MTRPLSDAGRNWKELRGVLYWRTIPCANFGRRLLCAWAGPAWELRGLVFGMSVWR